MEASDGNDFGWFGNGWTMGEKAQDDNREALTWYLNNTKFLHEPLVPTVQQDSGDQEPVQEEPAQQDSTSQEPTNEAVVEPESAKQEPAQLEQQDTTILETKQPTVIQQEIAEQEATQQVLHQPAPVSV